MNSNDEKDKKDMSVSGTPSSDTQKSQKPDASLIDVVNVVAERVEPIIQIIRTFAETKLKSKQSDAHFRIHMAWIAVILVATIVGVATLLAYTDRMDGAAYAFLLGTLTGYALTFIRDVVRPRQGNGDE